MTRVARLDGSSASLMAGDAQSPNARLSLAVLVFGIVDELGPATDERIFERYEELRRARGGDFKRRTPQALRTSRNQLVATGVVVAVDTDGRTALGFRATRWAAAPLATRPTA